MNLCRCLRYRGRNGPPAPVIRFQDLLRDMKAEEVCMRCGDPGHVLVTCTSRERERAAVAAAGGSDGQSPDGTDTAVDPIAEAEALLPSLCYICGQTSHAVRQCPKYVFGYVASVVSNVLVSLSSRYIYAFVFSVHFCLWAIRYLRRPCLGTAHASFVEVLTTRCETAQMAGTTGAIGIPVVAVDGTTVVNNLYAFKAQRCMQYDAPQARLSRCDVGTHAHKLVRA